MDYAHLPGGRIHYDQPESNENLRLAGGKRFIFTLLDANRVLVDGKLKPYPRNWSKMVREFEIQPVLHNWGQRLDGFLLLPDPSGQIYPPQTSLAGPNSGDQKASRP